VETLSPCRSCIFWSTIRIGELRMVFAPFFRFEIGATIKTSIKS
jgi:hypothetical protein